MSFLKEFLQYLQKGAKWKVIFGLFSVAVFLVFYLIGFSVNSHLNSEETINYTEDASSILFTSTEESNYKVVEDYSFESFNSATFS